MRLTNRSEYALLALVYLARQPQDQYAHGTEIAGQQQIPMRFLQQILLTLKRARLIASEKGRSGGYRLARKPGEITLAEVVRLFEGPIAPSRSASKFFYEPTPIERELKLVELLRELRELLAERLEKTTLADMV